jgi:hypothetical protein
VATRGRQFLAGTIDGRVAEVIRFLRPAVSRFAVVLVLFAALALGLTACGGSGDDSKTSTTDPTETAATPFIGTWNLYEGSTVGGTPTWYVHFREDGSFAISDNADGTRQRVSGTYTVTDGNLVGPFTNPRVGEGRVEATITNGVISLDFIEYWHSPYKHVPYVGTKR